MEIINVENVAIVMDEDEISKLIKHLRLANESSLESDTKFVNYMALKLGSILDKKVVKWNIKT